MSYNKTTHRSNTVEDVVDAVEESGGVRIHQSWSQKTIDYFDNPYSLEVIGKVPARGNNDRESHHDIRRLCVNGHVWLERMERNPDCDAPDWVMCHEFEIDNEPEYWNIDVDPTMPNSVNYITEIEYEK